MTEKDWSLDETINQVKHLLLEKDAEIVRLRGICKELLQHAEYMLSETEKAMEKDVTLLQKRISRARAALKDGE
jgi:Na+/phosphate symporter